MGFDDLTELCIGGVTKAELLARLRLKGVSLNDYARTLFADSAFTTSSEVRCVRVVQVSLAEIGLPDGGRFDEILIEAARLGLEPCPLEVGPHLRLAFLDQPMGPYLTVASRELRPGPETPNGFYLRRLEDGLWLRGYEAGPENVYPADFTDFVFVRPRGETACGSVEGRELTETMPTVDRAEAFRAHDLPEAIEVLSLTDWSTSSTSGEHTTYQALSSPSGDRK